MTKTRKHHRHDGGDRIIYWFINWIIVAGVPDNAECVQKKGSLRCESWMDAGDWDTNVFARCVRTVSFRLSDGSMATESVTGETGTTSSFEADVLTLGLNSIAIKSSATAAAKRDLKLKLELIPACAGI